jgi:type II secretion system protein N
MSEMMTPETGDTGMEAPHSAGKGVLKILSMSLVFISLIVFFTILKMPRSRVTDLIQGYIQAALDPSGIYIRSMDRTLDLFPVPKYRLDHPVVELSEQTQIEFDALEVRPSPLKLFTGAIGGQAMIRQGKGDLTLDGALRKNSISFEALLNEIDLGKIGAFSFAGIKGGGSLNGKIQIDGSPADFTVMNGVLDLKMKNVNIEEQSIFGFKVPPVLLSDGTVAADLKAGKLSLRNVALGRQNDDLLVTASGDIMLNRNLNSSLLNLRITLALSDKLKSAFSFIDMVLSGSKQKDGRYAFKLTGPLAQPTMLPETTN